MRSGAFPAMCATEPCVGRDAGSIHGFSSFFFSFSCEFGVCLEEGVDAVSVWLGEAEREGVWDWVVLEGEWEGEDWVVGIAFALCVIGEEVFAFEAGVWYAADTGDADAVEATEGGMGIGGWGEAATEGDAEEGGGCGDVLSEALDVSDCLGDCLGEGGLGEGDLIEGECGWGEVGRGEGECECEGYELMDVAALAVNVMPAVRRILDYSIGGCSIGGDWR